MITIGQYTIQHKTYKYRDPSDGQDKTRTDLFIEKPDGEGGSFNQEKLIRMLDRFWKDEF